MSESEKRTTFDVLKAAVTGKLLRIVGWAYKTRNHDGSIVFDSGGTTKNAKGEIIDATDQDLVDTPEAEKALADSLYGWIASGKDGVDDMHKTFKVGDGTGGIYIDDDVAEGLQRDGIEAALKLLGAVIDSTVSVDVATTLKSAAAESFKNILPRGALVVMHLDRNGETAKKVLAGKRLQMSVVAPVRREVLHGA